jgi:hypothetical protein
MEKTITDMLRTTPRGPLIDPAPLARCIATCFECAQACVACADACMMEGQSGALHRCLRLNLDCADICQTIGRLLSRQHEPSYRVLIAGLEVCALTCRTCADECALHAAHYEHCEICERTCRSCLAACQQLLSAFELASPR